MRFLYFLLILAIIYYAIRLIFRYVFPWLLKRWARKMGERMNQQQYYSHTNRRHKREGNVTIQYEKSQNDRRDQPEEGEYIDYEEINNAR